MNTTLGQALKFPALRRPFALTGACRRFAALLLAVVAPVAALQAQNNYATPYTFTTLAGSAIVGSADGTGNAARFYNPYGVGMDGAGNIYVADTYNHTIRKVTSGGVVTTLAGSVGNSGTADGTGSAARFYAPYAMAVDSAGNVYVADTSSHTIRKITPAGVVTTLAGMAGTAGSADGTGNAARFDTPQGVAVDSVGNIYVADTPKHIIRKITSAGVVTTFAGTAGTAGSVNGTGSAARFTYPYGVAVDSAGNVYVAETAAIRKITSTGVVTTLAGTGNSVGSADGTGSAAQFDNPSGLTVDSAGNVYVIDTDNRTVRKITPAGVVTTLAGTAHGVGSTDGTGAAAKFNEPHSITVDSTGTLYVADTANSSIRKITSAGVVTTFAGSLGGAGSTDGTGNAARFHYPRAVALDSAGSLYVTDTENSTIRKITSAGVVTTFAGTAGSWGSTDGTGSAALFSTPEGLALDSAGNLYVSDNGNFTIRKITPAGVVTTFAGTAGSSGTADGTGSAARFDDPANLAVDSAGNVYVAEYGKHTIRKITSAGVVTTLAGTAGTSGEANGTGSAARFYHPWGVAVDSAGNVYVADTWNALIRKITPAGVVTTLAGMHTTYSGTPDGTGSAARFEMPRAVTVDSAGNVFVADSNQLIRKITPAGVVTTVAGLDQMVGSADGTSSAARFYYPMGMAVDSAGTIYVADHDNSTIRKGIVTPAPIISSATTATGTINVAFTYQITAPNTPTAYTATGLPAGLTLNTTTGAISGTPTATGYATVALTAANTTAGTTALGTVTITIASGSSSSSSSSSSSGASSSSSSGAAPAPGGGGGGAPSSWFLAALALLGAGRRFAKKPASR